MAPWYDSQLHVLKQTARKLERKWHSFNLEESNFDDSMLRYEVWKNVVSKTIEKKTMRKCVIISVLHLIQSITTFYHQDFNMLLGLKELRDVPQSWIKGKPGLS